MTHIWRLEILWEEQSLGLSKREPEGIVKNGKYEILHMVGEELPIALTKFKTVDEAVQFSVKAVCELDLGDGQGFQGSLGIGTRTPSLTAAANFVRFAVITHEYKL
jgi:hypothetical protein